MKDSKRIWVWVGVVVVVLAIVFAFIWKPKSSQQATGPAAVFAPQGQLVPQFPKSLILDNNAIINGSYSINYSSSTNQYTAEFNSSSTMTTLYTQYKQYLLANGWAITNDVTSFPTFENVAGSNVSSTVSVNISKQDNGSQVAITYVTK